MQRETCQFSRQAFAQKLEDNKMEQGCTVGQVHRTESLWATTDHSYEKTNENFSTQVFKILSCSICEAL